MNIIERRKWFARNKLMRWWKKYRYIFYRIFLFPIAIPVLIANKLSDVRPFTNKRTKKYLDKVLPKIVVSTCSDINRFMIAKEDTQSIGDIYLKDFWNFGRRYSSYSLRYRDQVFRYLKDEYQIKGYTKYVADSKYSWGGIFGKHDFAPPYTFPYEVVLFIKK